MPSGNPQLRKENGYEREDHGDVDGPGENGALRKTLPKMLTSPTSSGTGRRSCRNRGFRSRREGMGTDGNDQHPAGRGERGGVGRRLTHGIEATAREEREFEPEEPRPCLLMESPTTVEGA